MAYSIFVAQNPETSLNISTSGFVVLKPMGFFELVFGYMPEMWPVINTTYYFTFYSTCNTSVIHPLMLSLLLKKVVADMCLNGTTEVSGTLNVIMSNR